MGLGSIDLVPLKHARDQAIDFRRQLLNGADPIDARRGERAAAARSITFQHSAEQYIAAHEAGWRNEKHRDQWKNTLKTYVYPIIGDLPVSDVDTALVLKVMEPMWKVKPETADRVRARLENILDSAKARGYRQGENPARWRGHLDKLLPKKSKIARVRHHPALPYVDIPTFMAELRAREGISAQALEFMILTAARTGAVVGATWSEIDMEARVWTVPASRMGAKIKGDELRRVPLSDRAISILRALPQEEGNPHCFIGGKAGKPMSNMAMLELMRGMGLDYVPHGFRSTFKDWCSETTNYPGEVSEAALWHVVADRVEAAYRRGELFEKRKRLMAEWARYCAKTPTGTGNVVPIRKRGAR